MTEFADLIKEIHPGLFVHSIYIDEDNEADQKAGFVRILMSPLYVPDAPRQYGNVNQQLELVAEQLSHVDELSAGFDTIGFSQGGQFLRAYVERYNNPPVHNLITFGSQHMGVSDLPVCGTWDLPCRAARSVARGAVYSPWVQDNIIMVRLP